MSNLILSLNDLIVRTAFRYNGFRTGWRSLPFSFVEFSPDGEWTVELENGKKVQIKKNQPFIISAFTRHNLKVENQEKIRTFWMRLPFSHRNGIDMLYRVNDLIVINRKQSARSRQIMMEIYNIKPYLNSLSAEAYLNRLAWELIQIILECVSVQKIEDERLERFGQILVFIKNNLNRRISREELASKMNLSPTRFHYVFREAFGMAPLEYVNISKLKLAEELLRNGDMSISEIADLCGFNSVFYFSRFFKEKTGYSPIQFRKILSGK